MTPAAIFAYSFHDQVSWLRVLEGRGTRRFSGGGRDRSSKTAENILGEEINGRKWRREIGETTENN